MARPHRRCPTPAASIDDWLNLVDPDGAFLTARPAAGCVPARLRPDAGRSPRAELRAQVADADHRPSVVEGRSPPVAARDGARMGRPARRGPAAPATVARSVPPSTASTSGPTRRCSTSTTPT